MSLSFSLLTYNILNPHHALKWETPEGFDVSDTGEHTDNWHRRGPQLVENIIQTGPDILCLQEINPETLVFFSQHLKGYTLATDCLHDVEKTCERYGLALFYKSSAWRVLSSEILTYAPEVGQIRRSVWALCQHIKTNMRIGVLNLHLKGYDLSLEPDHILAQAGAQEIEAYVDQLSSKFVCGMTIVAGDLNAGHDAYQKNAARFQHFLQNEFKPIWLEAATCQGKSIDWVFVRGAQQLSAHARVPNIPHLGASDHLPVLGCFKCVTP